MDGFISCKPLRILGVGDTGFNTVMHLNGKLELAETLIVHYEKQLLIEGKSNYILHVEKEKIKNNRRVLLNSDKERLVDCFEGVDVAVFVADLRNDYEKQCYKKLLKVFEGAILILVHSMITKEEKEIVNNIHKQSKRNVNVMLVQNEGDQVNETTIHAIRMFHNFYSMVNKPGYLNISFNDVKKALEKGKQFVVGIGSGIGERKLSVATKNALKSMTFCSNSFEAKAILVNFYANRQLAMDEINETIYLIKQEVGNIKNVKWGYIETFCANIRIAILITGIIKYE
ncbi:MAG: hypothetical protein HQK84_07050 [Nitrospinae bacterium]|nr:hypothetical protein [Nitrospinota bacterium]